MPEQDLLRKAESLTRAVDELRQNLGLNEATQVRLAETEQETRRTKWLARFTALGVALDIFLTILCGYLFNRVDQNTGNIKAGLCPVYASALASYNPDLIRDLGGDVEAYEASYNAIISASEQLDCPPAE